MACCTRWFDGLYAGTIRTCIMSAVKCWWVDGVYPDPRHKWPEPYVQTIGNRRHGGHSGYVYHRILKEDPCQECRIGEARYQRERRQRKRDRLAMKGAKG